MFDKMAIGGQILSRMKRVLNLEKDGEVASYFNLKPATIYNWKQRGTIPIEQCLQLVLEKGISLDWLVLGVGSGPNGEDETGGLPAIITVLKPSDHAEIPVYDMQNTNAFLDPDQAIGTAPFRKGWLKEHGLDIADLAVIRMPDDSMRITLERGDEILVNCPPNDVFHMADGVYLVAVFNELRVKRVQHLADGSLRLSSDNPVYAPETLNPEQVKKMEIVGRCYWRGGLI